MKIFVINAGSSSIKYQLFDMPDLTPVCVGQVEKIGSQAEIKHALKHMPDAPIKKTSDAHDHRAAMEEILNLLTDPHYGIIASADEIEVVGHRIVHGGEDFVSASVIDEAARKKIRSLFSLAPLHNPVNYACLEIAEDFFKTAIHIAVFDTAFHQSMPGHAYRYAIPEKYYRDEHIRVYGFHGTSHKFVSSEAAAFLGGMPAKLISIHLGNGCSITAVRDGQSVDTSMGFGPLAGLIMGTRSGDIDASVIFHLAEKCRMNVAEISDLLNKDSGLAGLTQLNDMRDIRQRIEAGDEMAKLAIEMYVYRIKKFIGSYAAVLNGINAIVFTAGVGENDMNIRSAVCSGMEFLGITVSAKLNALKNTGAREISEPGARVKVLVVPTNEELEIARQCYEVAKSLPTA
jgi:acetate kinase